MNSRRAFEWQIVFWALFFIFFVGMWWLTVGRMRQMLLVNDNGPTSSSDAYFYDSLRLKNGMKTVEQCVANLPPGSKVAVVYRMGSYQTLPVQLTCLGIWGRGYTAVEIDADQRSIRNELIAKAPAGVIWVDGRPPDWLPEVKPLAESFSYGPFVLSKP